MEKWIAKDLSAELEILIIGIRRLFKVWTRNRLTDSNPELLIIGKRPVHAKMWQWCDFIDDRLHGLTIETAEGLRGLNILLKTNTCDDLPFQPKRVVIERVSAVVGKVRTVVVRGER